MRTVRPAEMRLQIEHIGPVTVLNDCYNANPASMENAIDCLARMAAQQKRRGVFVAGDMKELGPHSASLHRQIGRFAAERGIRVILAAGEFAESVMEGARKTDNAGGRIEQLRTFGGVEGLCNNVHLFIRPDDIILVKASRSAHFESVVARLRDLFGKQQTTE
jgi:UDP-N-acetylmuramoyl-tripeptide--D-alanyl-D-alanine ligase